MVVGLIDRGDGEWFSEPSFGGPAERPCLLGEPGFWVETTTEQAARLACRQPKEA